MSNFYISRSHRRSSVDVKMLLKTLSILVNLICPQISRVALKLYEKFSNIINRLNIFRKETFWNNLSECCNTSQCQSDMVKYELRVAGYELRVTSLTARVESLKAHELKFKSTSSILEFRVQIYELRVQIHELRVQIHELRVQIRESLNQWKLK